MSYLEKTNAMVVDYGNTLVLDPFLRILKTRSSRFQKLLDARGYGTRWPEIAKLWIEKNEEINFPFISHFYQEEAIVEQTLLSAGIANSKDVAIISSGLLREYRQAFKEVLTKDKRRIKVAQTLDFLKNKNVKLAVVSNERQAALDLALRFYGIRPFFDSVLSSETICIEKPDARIFSRVLEILMSRPENAVYVGDDLERDIIPAKKIGMTAVLYIPPRKYSLKTSWRSCDYSNSNPDFIIKRFSELKQLFWHITKEKQ